MNKTLAFLFCISFTLFVLLFSYKIVLALTPTTTAQQQTMEWLHGEHNITLPYTSAEQSHLEDVKRVMYKVNTALYLSLLTNLAILFSLFFIKKDRQNALNMCSNASKTAMILLATIVSLLFISFNVL